MDNYFAGHCGVVIGAGSVVRTDVSDCTVAAVNPAGDVRYIAEEQRETAG
ncbi:hypothetical protein [Erwinia sp.]|nr:hypothetical protein [Erwinia sp.]